MRQTEDNGHPGHSRNTANGPRAADDICCPDCGSVFRLKRRAPRRSVPQHRRFFGLVKTAFEQWPEAYPFQPKDAEHLRAWLLIHAGHSRVAQSIRCQDSDPARLTAVLRASFSAAKAHAFVEVNGDLVQVIVPHSVAFEKLPHAAACTIMTAVDEIVQNVIGITSDELLRARP